MDKRERCTKCGEPLNPAKIVWLELSNTSGEYHADQIPKDHISQGSFPFGTACAKTILKEQDEANMLPAYYRRLLKRLPVPEKDGVHTLFPNGVIISGTWSERLRIWEIMMKELMWRDFEKFRWPLGPHRHYPWEPIVAGKVYSPPKIVEN